MTDNGTETRLVPIKGRTVVVKQLTDAQLLLLTRDVRILDDEKTPNRDKMNVAAGVLDMFESTLVQPSDRDYVLDLTRKGELELKDFVNFLTVFTEEPAPVEPAKPVVRRGRPRKTVAK